MRPGSRSILASLAAGALMLAASSPSPSLAQEADNVEASAGDLKIIHLWTKDTEGFMRAWEGPTPPRLPTSTTVERNQRITQAILYVNCTKDENGACHLSATVDITAPDGTPYGEPMTFDALKGKVTLGPNVIGLSQAGIGLVIEDGEQLGRYRIKINVTDENAGVTATSIVHIEAVEEGTLD